MSWTFTTSGSAIVKAGANANASIVLSGSILEKFSDEAEGYIVKRTRKNFVSDYSNLDTATQNLLEGIASDIIAKKIINYDTSGYSKSEGLTKLDVLTDDIESALSILTDFKNISVKSAV